MNDVTQFIADTIEHIFATRIDPTVSRPEPQFGDFATNAAMQLAKTLGKPPRDIAQQLADALRVQNDFAEVSIAGPGFINIRLTDAALWRYVTAKPQSFLQNQQIVFEYSCPNYFKELHAGHLYQTLVGDVLARLLERAGARVTRTNFGGDVGLHVAKCMWGIQHKLNGFNEEALGAISEHERTPFIAAAYVAGATAYEASETAKTEIEQLNRRIYEIQASGDRDSDDANIYWVCRDWSRAYFISLYESIQVTPFDRYYSESETMGSGVDMVKSHPDVFVESNGAIVFRGEEKGLHTRVFITKDGLPTYETKDLGVILLEHQEFAFEKRYIITGNDQAEYMKVVFAAAAEVMPEVAGKMSHITNGTIRFGDGKKMSSRLGNVSRAVDVIDLAKEAVIATGTDEPGVIALGAVKYSFLRQRVGGDIAFDVRDSVSLQGNSGPYLQYAAVRARSILQKVGTVTDVAPEMLEVGERLFAQRLAAYNDAVHTATVDLAPQVLCTYLYELAQEFNRFYENNRVIGDERAALRLNLVQIYADVLADGLGLLGIQVPQKM